MSAKIRGNEPCPCGSGKKYNNCCGKNASGAVLNQLYDRYKFNPNDQQSINDLFREIQDYARKILSKLCASNGWRSPAVVADDVVQTATLNIWKALATFGSRSKFSTWCYRIVQNAAIDTIRSIPDGKTEFLPWKAYAEYCGTAHGGSTGAAPNSGKAHDTFAHSLSGSPSKRQTDDAQGFGAGPLLPRDFVGQQENRLNADIDFRAILQELDSDDRQIAELFFASGYTALEIAEKFGKDTKRIGNKCSAGERWVQNRIAAIKTAFKARALSHIQDTGRGCLKAGESCVEPFRNPDGEADTFDGRLLDASSNSGPEDQQNRKRAA